MRRHANRAGPLLRWIHESNRHSGRREIAEASPCDRDRAIVRPVLRSFWQRGHVSGILYMVGQENNSTQNCSFIYGTVGQGFSRQKPMSWVLGQE